MLDPDLQGTIGRLNYGWWNQKPDYETTAQISSLTDALSQALMHCDLDDDCKKPTTRKILLAQMPVAKATQLLASITKPIFDLVVTQTDSSNKTVDGKVVRTLSPDTSPKFVVVPDEIYWPSLNPADPDTVPPTEKAEQYSPGTLTFRIQKATIQYPTPHPMEAPPPKLPQTWMLTNSVKEPAFKLKADTLGLPQIKAEPYCPVQDILKTLAMKTLLHERVTDPMANWSSAQVLQRLALLVMQHDPKHHADISLVQSRDLFRPEVYGQAPITNCNLQEVLERLFWKGDYAVEVPVTGATLTAILKASDTYTTLEANPTNIDSEKGRSLVTLGVFKEAADQNLVVNGGIVDPAKAYAVAMTDYLAFADTGYADLKTAIVPYPYRIKDFKKLDAISAMVCRAIKNAALKDAQCNYRELAADDHLDRSNDLPSDQTLGMTALYQMRSYLNPWSRWFRYRYFDNGQNAAEIASAKKRFWSFELEKGDLGLNFARPASASGLKNEFAGITIAPVTAPITYATTFDDRARLKFSTPTLDWFVLQESAYAYTRTGGASFTRNLSQNMLGAESGVLWHTWPARKRRPQAFDLLTAFRLETQVQAPREDIALSPLSPMPPGLNPGTLRRPIDLFGKLGMRYSDERSWFEAGYMAGRSLVNPFEIVFTGVSQPVRLIPGTNPNPNKDPTIAPANQDQPFLDWVKYLSSNPALNPLVNSKTNFFAHYTGRPLSGFFLNFSLNTPLPLGKRYPDWAGGKPIALLVENTGKWVFNDKDDLATQTKYYDKLAWSIVIPVIGNLTLKPEVDLIYFRNKSLDLPNQKTSFSFHSTTYITTLSYTFSWRQGQPLRRVWRYASPPPTTSVPSSGR